LITADIGYMRLYAVQVKVRVHGLRLLGYRLNTGLVCDESAAEGSLYANVALYKLTLLLLIAHVFHGVI